MRAILHNDMIVRFVSLPNLGCEVGPYEGKKELSVLRYDGTKIVNLNDLKILWVDEVSGKFVFHCRDTGNCVPVEMKYSDRDRLCYNKKGSLEIISKKRQLLIKMAAKNTATKNRRTRKTERQEKRYHTCTSDLLMMLVDKVLDGTTEHDQKLGLIQEAYRRIRKEEVYEMYGAGKRTLLKELKKIKDK